jgi:hypothetical protein
VKNTSNGVTGSDLQGAILAADQGDLLKVRGTCTGSFYMNQDITLVGPAKLSGGTCNDYYCDAGIVVTVDAGNVKLKKLMITDGYSTYEGGGIHNYGHLTLSSTAVRGNWAEDGAGGILNEGTLTMNWYSSVTDNWLLYGSGGGIWNRGTLIMNGWSRVEGNSATWGGGIYNQGTVVMNRRATVTANVAGIYGGGLVNDGGVVWYSPRWHGTLCGNTPDDWPTC